MKNKPSNSGKYMTSLLPNLHSLKVQIEKYAREYGLNFFDVIFEVLDWNQLNEVAAYGGFPNRYPHWRFGMEYEELSKSYSYGLSKIYEMVINTDPCYAYLLYSNGIVDQKLVMAHVYAHCDFFKNNIYFAHTNRKMMDEMANHKTRILRHIDAYGQEEVENFIDACLSLDTLIDYHAAAIKRRPPQHKNKESEHVVKRLRTTRPYMEDFINPDAFIKAQGRWLEAEAKKKKNFPETPERDILLFLLENAPLDNWERDILSIVREEAYYFAPQGQTKIMNEGWACVVPDTLIFTDRGLIPIKQLVENYIPASVSDGNGKQYISDYAKFGNRKIVKVKTRRGLELAGSTTHRVLTPDGKTWKRLDEVAIDDKIAVSNSPEIWPESYVSTDWLVRWRITLSDVAKQVGTSLSTIIRHRAGTVLSRSAVAIAMTMPAYEEDFASLSFSQNNRREIKVPACVDESLAAFLGYVIGDGHISKIKREVGLTTGDMEQIKKFELLSEELFGLKPHTRKDGGRYRVALYSEHLREFLLGLGLKEGQCAHEKTVPLAILRSPESVVKSFLSALFDCDGYAGTCGVILSTSSIEMSKVVQLLLINFGILSSRRPQPHKIWHVHIAGRSAQKFHKKIGFGLKRKQKKLESYINDRRWFKKEKWEDEIISIETGTSDVYDITVDETHRYAAQGFINHNSFWHSKIMTEKALKDSEIIDYADHHSGTMATHPGRLNPYKIGYELFKDIEDRWNKGKFGKDYEDCDSMVDKKHWDKKLGLGREKIFEVRKIYNDVTFIDTFLTPEFCQEQKLFVYAYDLSSNEMKIANKTFDSIKQKLLFQLTNFGHPIINVLDANYKNRAELLLEHVHEGVDLKLDYAFETLKNLFRLWRRPVNIKTIMDGIPKVLSFDGASTSETRA